MDAPKSSPLPSQETLEATANRLRQIVSSVKASSPLESMSTAEGPTKSAREQALERLRANSSDAVARRLRRKGIIRPPAESPFEMAIPAERTFPDAAELSPKEIAIGLERIIGRNELLGIQYLDAGQQAARCIGRIVVRRGPNRMVPMGTGFLVGPGLLMTNNHVLPTPESARGGIVEMNYQSGIDGRMLTPVAFALQPDRCFVTSRQQELDFTLIAVQDVAADGTPLSRFGYKPLATISDELLDGESVTIIQHPSGEPKQIALRENYVLKIPHTLDRYLYYQTDTSPGSSGSAVFNDDWEVVALHHSGYARRNEENEMMARDGRVWNSSMGESQIDWIANEGIRVNAIAGHLAQLVSGEPPSLLPEHRDLVRRAIATENTSPIAVVSPPDAENRPVDPVGAGSSIPPVARPTSEPQPGPVPSVSAKPIVRSSQVVDFTVNIPLQISVTIGTPQSAVQGEGQVAAAEVPGFEKIEIDTNYDNREGYDPSFLGGGTRKIPLPKLGENLVKLATRLKRPTDPRAPYELRYHHYSVVLNSERRLAFFTAVNIDGIEQQQLDKRAKDKWIFDDRIEQDRQIGNDWYGAPFDRGHLVRRLDPAWGRSSSIAKQANDDTFHFTNCSPQHARFNQGKNLWQGLENYLLDTANKEDRRISVFTGPVFAADDPVYNGVKVPRQFWKVAGWVRPDGTMGAAGFIISQADLLAAMGLEATAEQVARMFQVSIQSIEQQTGLSFGKLKTFDTRPAGTAPLESAASEPVELESLNQIQL